MPVGARFFAQVQTGPGAHPASFTMDTGPIPGVNRPKRGVDHPTSSKAKVKERVEFYLLLRLWAFVVCSGVRFTFNFTLTSLMV
jgi:DNA-binding sugar fermentation-stimulating protein